jgi:hypothetical protein
MSAQHTTEDKAFADQKQNNGFQQDLDLSADPCYGADTIYVVRNSATSGS